MVELADIVRQAGEAYRRAFGARLLPSHTRALEDILACRTPALGGSLFACDEDCGHLEFSRLDGFDIMKYLDLTRARRPGHDQRRVNVDFPIWMIESLDREASRLGVPRQSLIKMLIARHLEELGSTARP